MEARLRGVAERSPPAAVGLSLGLLQTLLLREEVDLGGELYKDLGLGISPRIDREAAGGGPLDGRGGDCSVELPLLVLLIGHGIHQPCSQSGAVSPFPKMAGAASALNGFLMMACAFAIGTWLARTMDGTVQPLTSGIWFWTVCIAFCAWFLVPRWGDVAAKPAPTP